MKPAGDDCGKDRDPHGPPQHVFQPIPSPRRGRFPPHMLLSPLWTAALSDGPGVAASG